MSTDSCIGEAVVEGALGDDAATGGETSTMACTADGGRGWMCHDDDDDDADRTAGREGVVAEASRDSGLTAEDSGRSDGDA